MFLPHLVAGESWSAPVSQPRCRKSADLGPPVASARFDPTPRPLGKRLPTAPLLQQTPSGFDETDPEQLALKQELCRMLIGHHPDFQPVGGPVLYAGRTCLPYAIG